jgi:hypothetical protein
MARGLFTWASNPRQMHSLLTRSSSGLLVSASRNCSGHRDRSFGRHVICKFRSTGVCSTSAIDYARQVHVKLPRRVSAAFCAAIEHILEGIENE